MKTTKTISGPDAITRMRNLRGVKDAWFSITHITCDISRGKSGEMRHVSRARLRSQIPDNQFKIDSDHFLAYEDMDIDQPRTCYKKLIRYVAFPPTYETLKVEWFKD